MTAPTLRLYHAPRTRAFTGLWLLEELGVPYERESFSLENGRHKQADYLALNPMGKVPVVVDDGLAIAETGAIAIYLADRYPNAGLAPAIDDPRRPDYLRWIFFSSAIMEPAYGEKFFKWQVPARSVAWGSFDQMAATITDAVTGREWLLGDTFSAADVLVGSTLRFGLNFGILPKEGAIADYVARCTARPAFERASAIEAEVGAQFPVPPSA